MNNYLTDKLKISIENTFTYHPPKDDQPTRYTMIRDKAKALAYSIAEFCPDSRERDLAFVKLEESVMMANASIARHE